LTQLLPADMDQVIEDFGHLFQVYPRFNDKNSIYADYRRTPKKLEVLFPLLIHPTHGITGLHARELYDDAGTVREYQYAWKRIIPVGGIKYSHICSWGNDSHPPETTPAELCVNTEPHHHHHVPAPDRRLRKDSYIYTLDRAFMYVAHYIETGETYYPDVASAISARGLI